MNVKALFSHGDTRTIRLVFILCLLSLVAVEILAYLSPQRGYEVSFYASTPALVFVLLGVVMIGGICILVQQVLSGRYRSSRVWLGGFALLLLTRMIILYLPYIRGYFSWMGDNSTHLGLVGEIAAKGVVDPKNFYPITHIYLAQIRLVTGLPIDFIVNHATAILSILFVLIVYALARMVFDDERQVILTIAAIGAVIFTGYEVYLMPNGWSCMYLPLAVYFIIRSIDARQHFSFKILALVTVVFFPFFHPFSTLMLIVVLALFIALTFVSGRAHAFRRFLPPGFQIMNVDAFTRFNVLALFLGIGATIWILWIVSFRRFDTNIRNLANALATSETFDTMGAMAVQANKMDFDLFDILILLVKEYGHQLVFLGTFVLGGYIFLKYRKTFSRSDDLLLLLTLPLAFGVLYFIYLAGVMPGLDFINAQRVLPYIILFTPIFSGIFFAHALSKGRSALTFACVLMLIAPALLSLPGVFPSPYLHRPTMDITEMDMKGMEWTFEYKDVDQPYVYIMSPPFRFADIVLGRTERDKRSDLDNVIKIPDHFNYGQNTYFGESFANTTFGLITEFDTVLYETAYERVGRFRTADFDRLQGDSTVNRIYSNAESTAYVVRGVAR